MQWLPLSGKFVHKANGTVTVQQQLTSRLVVVHMHVYVRVSGGNSDLEAIVTTKS